MLDDDRAIEETLKKKSWTLRWDKKARSNYMLTWKVNLNSPYPIKEIKFLVENLPTEKMSGPDDFTSFTGEFSHLLENSPKCFRKKIIPILHILIQKIEEEGILPAYSEASITLITKTKDISGK